MIADAEILAVRGPKNSVSADRPYAFLVESECSAEGRVEDVGTIFLTNRECPFRCLMCDLWQNTTDERVSVGSIPAQIDYALERLPAFNHIKLYNSGNFFDAQAIPPEDHDAIIGRVREFRTVIVENHPALCSDTCLRFRDRLNTEMEVAIGLETIHPDVLPKLNKRMTADDFSRAAEFLTRNGVHVRTFVLLKPPFLTEEEGVDWALRSVEFAFDAGARVCSIVPTRSGNGVMDRLQDRGEFSPPGLESLERVLDAGLDLRRGRVFVDLWDAEQFARCDDCRDERIDRLRRMNLEQQPHTPVRCIRCR